MNMKEQKLIPKDKMDIDIAPKPPKYMDADYSTSSSFFFFCSID